MKMAGLSAIEADFGMIPDTRIIIQFKKIKDSINPEYFTALYNIVR